MNSKAFSFFSLCVVGALAANGCSTLGTPTSSSEGFPHGGVGLFRELCPAETNLPSGAIATATSVESSMLVGEYFFYAGASAIPVPLPTDAGVVDAGRDAATQDAAAVRDASAEAGVRDAASEAGRATNIGRRVDWSRFNPRQIYRTQRNAREYGAREGSVVLSASLPWEGGYVSDPWALVDGERVFLYYAAAGGIGVATGATLNGTFQKEGSQIFPAGRHPSVVNVRGLGLFPKDYVMFFEINERVAYALSSDGIHFDAPQDTPLVELGPRDSRDGQEIGRGAPGAVVVRTQAGRNMVRVYYESRRSNGLVVIAFAATANGTDFDVLWRPVFAYPSSSDALGNLYAPAPFIYNDRITLLYLTGVGMNGRGAVRGAVTPDTVNLGAMPCGS